MESTLTQTQLPNRISLAQAAQLSGYHQDYLGQLCRLGKLRAAKIGRNWYTTQSELQSLVNNSEAYGLLNQALNVTDQPGDTQTEDSQTESYFQNETLVQDEPSALIDSDEQPQSVPQVERAMQIPVVASNYVISEVEAMPIKLEEKTQVANSHHTLQTLITRMKLDDLKTEVLQVTGLIGELSEEVMSHTEILNRHEKMLQARSDLRDQYSPSLSFSEMSKPVVSVIDYDQDLSSLNQENSTKVFWLWPVLTLFLAVVVSGILIKSNNSDTQPQLSTVIYKPAQTLPQTELVPQVAGEQTSVVSNPVTPVQK